MGFGLHTCEHATDVFADARPMFKPVPRATANEPDVFSFGMAINQEIAGRGVLVLAHPRLNNGSVSECGESFSKIAAGLCDGFGGD